MKALVLEAYNRLECRDVAEPAIGPNELLVNVKACGICGSDVHGLDGSTGRRIPPVIMGHEAAGVVAEVGSQARGWQPGERVTFDSNIYCGVCRYCRKGKINLCDNRRVLGVSCGEFRQDGAFAEYVAVPQQCVYRLPDALSFERAALVEPVSIALHAVGRPTIKLNDRVVVVGAGMIGLLLVQALRAAGCGHIIVIDLLPNRLDLACQLGANAGLRADAPDVLNQVQERLDGGAELVFEAVGTPPAVQIAFECLRKGGALTLIGNVSPTAVLPLQRVVTRELTLYGSCQSTGEYPACLDLMARGAINVDSLISAVAPLAEGAAWFEKLRQRNSGLLKVVLIP
ncbi:MAG: galactitol-1-phosphate 5-dehydrogenase [Acidobacteriia bacterium]|nr:galactitol-1-phosphate 5-dehydrogenase [Terriglobia bacterium]